ncbi:MAG: flagellar FlbD family protein [Terriglobales bacterium]|jgi:flagellar protein FlbD
MIQLTRLNNQPFAVNSDLIKFIEKAPDTVVTLTSGEKIVVLETPEIVIEKVVAFRRTLLDGLGSFAAGSTSAMTSLRNPNTEPQPSRTSENTSLG